MTADITDDIYFFDPTDEIAIKKGLYIEFFHVASGKTAVFKAFLTAFEDSFETSWNEEQAYGRMDPIQTYQSTKRTLNLGWTLPAATIAEARTNMAEVSRFIRMQYPVYSNAGTEGFSATAIAAPPLIKVKFANLVQSSLGFSGARDVEASSAVSIIKSNSPANPDVFDFTAGESKEGKSATGAENAGLLGSVAGFNFSPVIEDGFFDPGFGTIYPKTLECTCQMTIIHQHPLGFDEDGNFRSSNFPYGFYDSSDAKTPRQKNKAQPEEIPLGTSPTEEQLEQQREDANQAVDESAGNTLTRSQNTSIRAGGAVGLN